MASFHVVFPADSDKATSSSPFQVTIKLHLNLQLRGSTRQIGNRLSDPLCQNRVRVAIDRADRINDHPKVMDARAVRIHA